MEKIQNKRRILDLLSQLFFVFNFCLVLTCIRLPELLQQPILRFFLYFIFLIGFLISLSSFTLKSKKISISFLFFIFAICLHAIFIFYQPSIAWNVPIQNYVLQDNITANFALTQTRLYLIFFVLFLFPSLDFINLLFTRKYNRKILYLFLFIFFIGLVLNLFVSIIQGFINISFLSAGSGTTLSAGRTSGLLDDSGCASIVFTIFSCFLLTSFFNHSNSLKEKVIFLVFFILSLSAGIANNSRFFFIAFFFSTFFILLKAIFEKKEINYFYKFVTIFSCLFFIFLSLMFIKKYAHFSSLDRVLIFINNFHSSHNSSFMNIYFNFDYPRALQLSAMLNSIKEHFWSGTGWGGFAVDFSYYCQILAENTSKHINSNLYNNLYSYLDLPTNIYVYLVTALGPVGLLLVFFSLFLFISFLISPYQRKIVNSHNKRSELMVGNTLPTCIGIVLCLAFSSALFISYPLGGFLCAFCFSALLLSFILRYPRMENFVAWIFSLASIYLISVCFYLSITAPNSLEFRWKERGVPQIPASMNVLPQPQGNQDHNKIYFSNLFSRAFNKLSGKNHLKTPQDAQPGRWFPFGSEILLNQKRSRIFIDMENLGSETVYIYLIFRSSQGNQLNKKIYISKSQWIEVNLPEGYQNCLNHASPESYCSLKIDLYQPNKTNFFGLNDHLYIEDKLLDIKKEISKLNQN